MKARKILAVSTALLIAAGLGACGGGWRWHRTRVRRQRRPRVDDLLAQLHHR